MVEVKPALARKPPSELSVGKRIEQADHADRNGAILDKIDHGLGNRDLLTVETHDEARGHKYPGAVNSVNALDEISTRVLFLFHCDKRDGIWTFDTDKNQEKVCRFHHLQER